MSIAQSQDGWRGVGEYGWSIHVCILTPLEQLRTLQKEILALTTSSHAGICRMSLMDLAWFLLMLHSGK